MDRPKLVPTVANQPSLTVCFVSYNVSGAAKRAVVIVSTSHYVIVEVNTVYRVVTRQLKQCTYVHEAKTSTGRRSFCVIIGTPSVAVWL